MDSRDEDEAVTSHFPVMSSCVLVSIVRFGSFV